MAEPREPTREQQGVIERLAFRWESISVFCNPDGTVDLRCYGPQGMAYEEYLISGEGAVVRKTDLLTT